MQGYNKAMVEKLLSSVKLLHIWPMPHFDILIGDYYIGWYYLECSLNWTITDVFTQA